MCMKKVFIILTASLFGVLFATSCCNCDKENGKCHSNEQMEDCNGPRHHKHDGHGPEGFKPEGCPFAAENECPAEMKEQFEKWMKFDSLSVEEQKALLKEKKAEIDKREAEIAAKKAEMEQKWANFDSLSVEEQKQLIDIKMGPKMCPKQFPNKHHGDKKPHHHGHPGDKGDFNK